jgi:hypothetical protein
VYQVYDAIEERVLAIKVVDLKDADANVRQCYQNEIDLLKRLQHSERVVKVFD